ncbi:MAG: HIT domain-containing protein [Deltaproteobacteria bacterium]|nr:HIT domain-containing protein [Deltaproteobacteria bacterium]MBW2283440.1 HIT domain-containing protein [Deltaproteobacteria bacterium]
MSVLWAPWRMEYILSDPSSGECIFCPGQDRDRDEERLVLHVGDMSMVMMNRYPYNNGHLLVAPVRHAPDLDPLGADEKLDLLEMVQSSIEALRGVMNPEGFNVGLNLGRVAGAGVEAHMHFHIVPRWNGDTNFMTVLGEVRVVPEHIRATYLKLLPFFQAIGESGGNR